MLCNCGCELKVNKGRSYIHGHNRRGVKQSKKARELISEGLKRAYKFGERKLPSKRVIKIFIQKTKSTRFKKGFDERRLKTQFKETNNKKWSSKEKNKYGRIARKKIQEKWCVVLTPEFHVHHIDGDISNNKDGNLVVIDRRLHSRLHYLQRNGVGMQ